MKLYKKIFENNKAWIEKKKTVDSNYFADLSEGQSPEILYIGCSDSRVTAEEVTGVGPGQMFVHRNVGNIIPNNDLSSATVIDYAVKHLQIKHIVICGHYFCGGVKAAMEAKDLGILNPWLRNIRDVYRLHKEELNNITDSNERYKRLVELNVKEQCINVLKTAAVQTSYLETGYPTVHGWVFDVSTGKLIDLNIDFDHELEEIREIYDLGNLKK
ncbi:carbonic anhydrase [Avrilella dinanensis]|uniref:carbonic anhydrase n=1 Tax=Avrilella dinanensis TaxID=2008672 RepID=UPI0024099B2F|nr:carbonic anhydrase [Avrilella dinanensis]